MQCGSKAGWDLGPFVGVLAAGKMLLISNISTKHKERED